MGGISRRRSLRRSIRTAVICAAAACLLPLSCNNFSLVGLLDSNPNPPSAPGALKLLPDSVNVKDGTSRQFVATGGSGGYTYSMGPGGIGTVNSSTGMYQAPTGVFGTDTIIVTDSSGATSESTAMVVSSLPLSLTPTSTSVAAGGSVFFTASGGPAGACGARHPRIGNIVGGTYTAPWAGGTAVIRLTDASSDYREAAITVNAPTAVQVSPSTVTVDAHGSVALTASGGSGSYNNALTGVGSLAWPVYTAPWTGGSATVTVTDTNTGGAAVANITVNLPPALQISPASANINDNGSVTFTASGGTGIPGNYSYTKISGSGSMAGATYTPQAGLATTAVIQAKDAVTLRTSNATVNVTVPVVLTISPKTVAIDAGGSVSFTTGEARAGMRTLWFQAEAAL